MTLLEEGTVLQGRYRVVRQVGGGGMGRVYLAHDTRLADKPCAVKELRQDPHLPPAEQEQVTAQFHREAAMLAHLSHANLPNVYDYFQEYERFYLVMDFVEGETLEQRLYRSPQGLPPETVVDWGVQLCDVLTYLHGQNPPVIFRDLKPANIMVTPQGQLKLIDFGVARLFDPSKGTDTLKMGTAGYAPPEQYAGRGQTTPRSDIYSLGATLHELLTGEDPTAHPFVFSVPHKLKPAVPASLSNIVMRALNMNPAERFPSAQAMKEALQKASQPRFWRFPSGQPQLPRKTRVLPAATATTPSGERRPLRVMRGIVRWTVRLVVPILFAVVLLALLSLLVGSLILSAVAERTIADTDWGWQSSRARMYVLTETDLRAGVQNVVDLYGLDAVRNVQADFQPPDRAVIALDAGRHRYWLLARLGVESGAPTVRLERLNGTPLYFVGSIISGGINRGFRRAWENSPPVVLLNVLPAQLIIEFDR